MKEMFKFIPLIIYLVVLLSGCRALDKKIIQKSSKAQPTIVPIPHYHTLSWEPSYWYKESNDIIEYSLFSTTNLVNWDFEGFTTDTNYFVTNNYPCQYYTVGAH